MLLVILAIPFIAKAADAAEKSEAQVNLTSLMTSANQLNRLLDALDITLDLESKIRLSATMYGVNESLALNIACAESQFIASAKNPASTAGGVYQFLDGTWKVYGLKYWGSLEGRSKLDADDNIELAMLVLKTHGSSDWLASKHEGLGGGWSQSPYEKGLCTK